MTASHSHRFDTGHRPYPPPETPYVMRQTWSQLLFAHWRVSADDLQKHLPSGLQLDTFEGEAWLGIVPFQMSDVSLRGVPAVPILSKFLELNVRTYVTRDGKPGVLFFSLDATNPLAVETARLWFCLPYFHAAMKIKNSSGRVEYISRRKDQRGSDASLRVRYQPAGPVFAAQPGSLEHWLTERYCLYTACHGKLFRGEIHHQQWPLQPATAEFLENSMTAGLDLPFLDEQPLLHYAESIKTFEWTIAPV